MSRRKQLQQQIAFAEKHWHQQQLQAKHHQYYWQQRLAPYQPWLVLASVSALAINWRRGGLKKGTSPVRYFGRLLFLSLFTKLRNKGIRYLTKTFILKW